ncbi:leucine-rich repeat-containing protein 9 [Chiloscyllium plagiosum]|uniref:leucine-rich repeat-containing protein 9 n=1 Tax=Chiloscyllium plagiosum TaxID=36176 RepID=UPI001CB7F6DC|nr:leucine-rich repeat-containing protein 9 [Chiloscyllium plagiosum]
MNSEMIQIQDETEEIFKELCMCNGLSYEKIAQEGPSVTELEMFFSGYPQMVGLLYFPNLVVLTLVKQNITKIEGLEACPLLTQLWIVECHITDINGLNYCTNLRRLYLYYNRITKIKNLENLKKLEILWLNNNKIKVIEGLNTLTHLKELNLAGNLIDVISNSLDFNVQLEWLNLSGNKICSFKELTNLVRLPELQILSLKDPQYAPNPVTLLSNYMTHVVYHMPKLLRLDTYDVSNKQAKDFAESTVMKKTMYYRMRIKDIRRQQAEIVAKLQKQISSLQDVPKERINTIGFCIKTLESELTKLYLSKRPNSVKTFLNGLRNKDRNEEMYSNSNSLKDNTEGSNEEQKMCQKLDALKERLTFWNNRLDETEVKYQTELKPIVDFFNLSILFLLIELETVGNIRFEEGTPSDVWFTSCYDVILSRFCAWDFKKLGVTGLKINRIVRVHNRVLRLKYEDKIQSILNKEGSPFKSENYSKMLEYLFYIYDPKLSTEKNEILQILEGGFKKADVYRLQGRDEAVPLCNSMSLCEQPRIDYLQQQAKVQNTNVFDAIPFRYGQLIIAKVFLGHSVQAIDSEPVEQLKYPNANSVYRPRKVNTRCANDTGFSSSLKFHGSCDCSLRQYEWFVFDHELVVPEYFIDFEYITQNDGQTFYSAFSENKIHPRKQSKAEILIIQRAMAFDEEVLKMDPIVTQSHKIPNLEEITLLSASGASILSQITILNLHGNGLRKLKGISRLSNLQKLVISFNELTQLNDLSNLSHLRFLDASHNQLITLDGFTGMENLNYLDLSWNQLTYIKKEIGVLHKHAFELLTLDLSHNPWKKPDLLRPLVIGQLKTLTYLNGSIVMEEETLAALQMIAESKITQVSLLAHSRTDEERPRCLSLLNCAQNLTQLSKKKPNPSVDQSTNWFSTITTLNLDGQNLSRLTNLDRLENLRWASFNNNIIHRFEGLDHCLQLEELSLEDNFISELEGISKLMKLTRLNLGNNQLKSLEGCGLDKLTHLHYLSLENNNICSLRCLQKIYTLIELYLGNNLIVNNCEIYHLKGMENLVILDLYGNPLVCKQEHYRLFVIYHLPSLRAFDGNVVEPAESENAKDVFGGRLTADMVTERLGHSNFSEILKLEMPESAIRSVDLGPSEKFGRLQRINLERNNLTSFSGLVYLPRVKVLYLNHNHIETILPRQKPQLHLTNRQILQQKVSSSGYGQSGLSRSNSRDVNYENLPPVMESLEVLHLGYNGISSLIQLQLNRLVNLRVLCLEGNFISQVEGLDCLQNLVELSLERNRVRMIHENSFLGQTSLIELHLEENRMRDLNNLYPLVKLQRLFLGVNKIQDIGELEKLDSLPNLTELSVVGNPVSRKMLYRPFLVFRLTKLQILDGVPVTMDEKEKAEFLLCEHNTMPSSSMETGLAAIMPLLTRPNTLRTTNSLPKGLQPFSGPDFNLPHGFGDSVPQEPVRNKRPKHLGANLPNTRTFQSDIICRQIRSGATYQPAYMQQQRDSSRNMRTLMQIQDQDGRVHNSSASKPSQM